MKAGQPASRGKIPGLHPAVLGCALLITVFVGRLVDVFPILAALSIGKLAALYSLAVLVASKTPVDRSVFGYPISRRVIVLFLLAVASVSFSVWKSQSLQFLWHLVVVAVMYFLVVLTCKSVRVLRIYVTAILICAMLLALMTISVGSTGREVVETNYDPNDLAMFLVANLPFVLVRFLVVARGLRSGIYVGLGIIMLLGFGFTQSRGGLVAMAIVFAAIVMTDLRPTKPTGGWRWPSPKLALLVAILAATFWSFAPPESKERFSTLLDLSEDYNVTAEDSGGRLDIWQRAVSIIIARPWGSGIGTSSAAEGGAGGRYKAIHNSILEIGVDLGVIGILLYLSFFSQAFKALRRAALRLSATPELLPGERGELYSYAVGCRIALVGVFVAGIFLSHAYTGMLYLLVALAASIDRIALDMTVNETGPVLTRAQKLLQSAPDS